MTLFKVRTFRISILGSFATRLGVGGIPFLLPLLYQIGLGYSTIQSGLLIIPQPFAAMSLKLLMPRVLARFGYRRVLLVNPVLMGVVIMLFTGVHPGTPVLVILGLAFCLGFFNSMQYTCLNTMVFADLPEKDTSPASSISSTVQQMSMSFGVAVASLLAAAYLGREHLPSPAEMVTGIHRTLLTLGTMTILAALIFRPLLPLDGANISRHRES